ncbi:synapsin-2-like, partial [Sinocyclocheilus grahami]|uniref:synapsin-2-like n=1 Tax=Sinocyclocheilus grahami TaxID=75366 RepID=UPI0007ACD9DF
MNYLRRRLSDSSFVANLPNGYMMDLQRPSSSSSSPASPATERRPPPAPAPAPAPTPAPGPAGFLSSFSSVVKTAQIASAVQAKASAAHADAAKPAERKPKVLLVIDEPHTD